jgi:hypothetical protein
MQQQGQQQVELPLTIDKRPANFDLIGKTYRAFTSMVRVIGLDPLKPESSVDVQDLRTNQQWTVPSGVIRRILELPADHARDVR